MSRLCIAASFLIVLAAVAIAADPAATTPAPSTAPASLPAAELEKFEQMLQQRPGTKEEFVKWAGDILKRGAELENAYPRAADLYQVQMTMIQAANFLAREKDDAAARKQLEETAGRVLASQAPSQDKMRAEFILVFSRIMPGKTPPTDLDAAAKEVRAVFDKYNKGPTAAEAQTMARQLAKAAKLDRLRSELLGDVTFEAELTKLDGTKLSLPKDLAGKVLVVDFWASWCPPCRASAPALKEVYGKYKDKGVEFVGISLDKPDGKEAAEKFIADNGLNWIQTYSGKYWQDPTARKYGIDSIPALWIVGKDGKVVADGVDHENMAAALAKVLDKTLEKR